MLKFIREIYWQISGKWYVIKTRPCRDCGCTQSNIVKRGNYWRPECVGCGANISWMFYEKLYMALKEEGWFYQTRNKFLKLIRKNNIKD